MRFFSTIVSALAAFATLAAAQLPTKGNAITAPTVGDTIVAGETYTIEWMNIVGDDVTLTLMTGPEDGLETVAVIVTGADNTGSYTWTVPESIPAGSSYTIRISYDQNSNNFNYSNRFTVDSDVTATTTRASSTASITSSASSTESESTTTESSTTESESSTTSAATTTETQTNSTTVRSTTTRRSSSTSSAPQSTSSGAPDEGAASSTLSSPLAVIMAVLAAALFIH